MCPFTVTLERFTIEVQDNGLGMSEEVISDYLLNFGGSFWSSSAMRRQFPGLLAKGPRNTGTYGIGFFSVFMLGDDVTVWTRRIGEAAAKTIKLSFARGLHWRPIVGLANTHEQLADCGTRVTVTLRTNPYEDEDFLL